MASALQTRAEIAKLAQLLNLDPSELAYLDKLPCEDVRRLREQATDRLFDAHLAALEKAVAASKRLPTSLSVTIGQRALGALLCARIAGLLDPADARDFASRMPPEFLADVAVELDPRRASAVIGGLPADQIVPVAAELLRRGEHVTMGRFVGHLTDQAIIATAELIDDGDLLRIAFVLDDKRQLEDVLDLVGDDRLAGLLQAASDHDLWPEALDLVVHLGAERRAELAELVSELDDAELDRIIDAALEHDLWGSVLPITHSMTEVNRRRFTRLASVHRAEVLDAIVRTAIEERLWPDLLPLVPMLPARARRRVVATAHALGDGHREAVPDIGAALDALDAEAA